jgi:hypothetical protein
MPLCSCEICDNVFTSTHIDAMYCSVLCRNKARYTKHKAKYREKVIRVYGITGIIYEQMLEQQEFVCAICKQEEKAINPNTGYPFPLSIDHNHKTNKVRGLLCKHCNLVLGQIEKNPNIVESCLKYLKQTDELKKTKGV